MSKEIQIDGAGVKRYPYFLSNKERDILIDLVWSSYNDLKALVTVEEYNDLVAALGDLNVCKSK